MTRFVRSWLGVAATTATLAFGGGQAFAQKEIVVGLQCDRTGPTANVGTILCPGYHDYIALVNSKGGVEGYKIKVLEIDHEYKVPGGMEAHERFKKEGAVVEFVYGTPHAAALSKKLEEDKIIGTTPGFGTSASADGKRFPYLFPIAASYWSQAGAAVAFVKEKLGDLKGKKIAYLFYDNPRAGSRCRSSRSSPRPRASSCGPSRCRRPGWRWAPRSSTSPADSSRTSSSRTCSGAHPRFPSRS
jgi:branched-chain amino acid transport system substrate-binding protein